MKWWMRPAHAMMLFESERQMDKDLWESMHWKLYSACGRNHCFLEGLHSLYAVALHYEHIHEGETSKFQHGDCE